MPGMSTEDNYESIDTNAVAAEIASEMGFGEDYSEDTLETGEDGKALIKPAEGEEKSLGETVPPEDQSKTTPAQPAFKALPKSWKKEMEPHWAKLDPALHDYVYQREADVMRGLQQYAEGHNRWNAAVGPFQNVFQQHPHVKPEEVFQRLMQTHLGLMSGSPEQKRELLLKIAQEYQVDLAAQAAAEGAKPGETLSPVVEKALRAAFQEIHSLKEVQARKDAEALKAIQSENEKTVAAFAADPKNKYFEEVGDTIVHLLKTGAAKDLPSAYELACYTNPEVRAKIIADLKGPATPSRKNGSNEFPNLDSSPDVRPRRQRAVTIDDTIDSIVSKYAKSNL